MTKFNSLEVNKQPRSKSRVAVACLLSMFEVLGLATNPAEIKRS